jgi:acetoacetyl-CoA synthetase
MLDMRPADRFMWFTTTGWMMWNYNVSALLVGATVVLYDGNPSAPDPYRLFDLAARTGLTHLGVSATYIMNARKQGLEPREHYDLGRLRHFGSTGSPLAAEGAEWVYEYVSDSVVLGSASGGSDVCSAFVGASPMVPVWAGEISCRCLGVDVQAFDSEGTPVVGELGELVVVRPMPSMPVSLWGDPDGRRLCDAYYAVFPGVWRHGDWVQFAERGSSIITGRSDATLNRGGVRLGTAELYTVVEDDPAIVDSLVVHLDGDVARPAGLSYCSCSSFRGRARRPARGSVA